MCMFMEDRKTADIVQILLIRHNLYIYAYVLSTPYSFGVLFCILYNSVTISHYYSYIYNYRFVLKD